MSQTLPRMDQTHASPKPTDRRPPQPLPSPSQDRLQVTETRARPVSSLSSGYGSAVSNAVAELKEKAIYKAEVVRQYKWESSNCNDVVLQVSSRVHVCMYGHVSADLVAQVNTVLYYSQAHSYLRCQWAHSHLRCQWVLRQG